MPASKRDEFSPKTKAVIAGRVNYICSKPDHRVFTMQAHSDPEKALSSGVAAHIRGAAEEGPRYDGNQTPAQRRHPSNGLWLCHACSDIVDKDEGKYTVRVLEQWREDQEKWVAKQGGSPTLPEISVVTIDGLSQPPRGGRVTGADVDFFREHHFKAKNVGSERLASFSGRLQLPERAKILGVRSTAGVVVEISAERMEFRAISKGSGFVEFPDVSDLAHPNFTFSINHLLPGDEAEVRFLSGQDDPLNPSTIKPPGKLRDALSYFVEGSFLYERNQSLLRTLFVVPIDVDAAVRKLTSTACEEDADARVRWKSMVSW